MVLFFVLAFGERANIPLDAKLFGVSTQQI